MKYRLQFNPGEVAYKPQLFTDAIKILVSVNFGIYFCLLYTSDAADE